MNTIVSVIITTHERDISILKRAIDSVCCQTYPFIEIIVVNDALNYKYRTELETMIGKYKNVKYFLNDKAPGACTSRNIGIKNAKGDVIALLDDDDTFEPQKIEKMIPLFQGNIGLVYCDVNQVEKGIVVKRNKLRVFEGNVFNNLFYGNFIGGCSVPIFLREVFDSVGFFDEKLPSSQDIDMWIRIAEKYDVRYLDECLVNYYVSDIAITANPIKRVNGWLMILNKYAEHFKKDRDAERIWQGYILELLFQHGKFKEGLAFYNNWNKGINKLIQLKTIIRGVLKNIQMRLGGRKR